MIKRVVDFFGEERYVRQRRLFYLTRSGRHRRLLVFREHAEYLWNRFGWLGRLRPSPVCFHLRFSSSAIRRLMGEDYCD
jgi:hypothetical protein